ncbi:LPO_1073/Vpar_1526 family protein, partial [Bacillus hominis]|uniref:LPO_1073/Vpar_1526 family protein n=1 Tax=Bacillus hominis TaxID=2817478 RepID=UPI0034D964E6
MEELQKKSPLSVQNTQDPDVRYSLFEVQKSYARHGNMEKSELLVDLLVRRTLIKQHSFETIVLNEALTTVPKLTLEQMNILSLIFIVVEIYLEGNPPFEFYYDTFFDKFLDIINIPQGRMFYEHLIYSGCITMDKNSGTLK